MVGVYEDEANDGVIFTPEATKVNERTQGQLGEHVSRYVIHFVHMHEYFILSYHFQGSLVMNINLLLSLVKPLVCDSCMLEVPNNFKWKNNEMFIFICI